MITKERLEELIKQGALIFYILNNSVALLRLDNSYGISVEEYNKEHNCKPQFYHAGFVYQNICDADKIFETKEEAEWYLEFGNITRTETLSLPSWEEVQEMLKVDCNEYQIVEKYNIKLYLEGNRYFPMQIKLCVDYGIYHENFNWNLSKENYIKACRMAKELFLEVEI